MDGERIVEQLYRTRSAGLTRSFARSATSRQDAADRLHSVFARFIVRLRHEPMDSPAAYLQRMVANEEVSGIRTERRDREISESLAESRPTSVDILGQIEARDMLRRVEAALLRLKPKTRQIFLAHRVEGLSYAEIGERHGLSIKGVEKQMAKALLHLDRCLGRGGA
ncbi:sigma-70 family RNA polymerase sigma factor [Sphingomonas sp. ASV193]|uniref:RNA polymerase sigma factor n=1 Tax=Sphingomonas sp. ASV193 TaxID=3144405 RepID=UPI0032E8ACD9